MPTEAITAADIRQDSTLIGALYASGKSCAEIGKMAGLHKATIARRLKHLNPRYATEIYKYKRADVLAELQRKILNTCDYPAIQKMPAGQKIMALGILYDKERLERGQSTGNLAVNHGVNADTAALLDKIVNRDAEIKAKNIEALTLTGVNQQTPGDAG